MSKSRFTSLIFILAILLSSCANFPLAETKTLEDYRMPTDEPDPITMAQTAQTEIEGRIPPADCPVTVSSTSSFEPPAPHPPTAPWAGIFWFGSESLWTALRTDGVWAQLPLNPEGYTQKIMWWSSSYSLPDELKPALVVTGERLDDESPPLKYYGATNAFADDIGDAMLTGVDFPTHGCWKITGQYKNTELSFVVWVAP